MRYLFFCGKNRMAHIVAFVFFVVLIFSNECCAKCCQEVAPGLGFSYDVATEVISDSASCSEGFADFGAGSDVGEDGRCHGPSCVSDEECGETQTIERCSGSDLEEIKITWSCSGSPKECTSSETVISSDNCAVKEDWSLDDALCDGDEICYKMFRKKCQKDDDGARCVIDKRNPTGTNHCTFDCSKLIYKEDSAMCSTDHTCTQEYYGHKCTDYWGTVSPRCVPNKSDIKESSIDCPDPLKCTMLGASNCGCSYQNPVSQCEAAFGKGFFQCWAPTADECFPLDFTGEQCHLQILVSDRN